MNGEKGLQKSRKSPAGACLAKRLAVAALAMAWSLATHADAVLEFTSRVADGDPVERILIVKDGRVGFLADDGGVVHTIFDQAESTFAFVNHDDRQYTIISAQWMREMQQRAKESMKRMQEKMDQQLKNMPPEQRAMYQQGRMMMPMMMPTYMTNLTQPNQFRTAVPLFLKQSINGVQCQRVDLLEGGRKVQELCIAQRQQISGLSDADYQTLLAMLKVAQELDALGAFALGFKRPFIAAWGGGRPGLPVSVTEHSAAASTVTKLQSLRNEPVDAARLELPGDYLQAQIPLPIR